MAKTALDVFVDELLEESPQSQYSLWLCPHCGQAADIEAIEPRKCDGVLLTYWHCQRCQVWAVTPATIRQPPVWVSKKTQ
jgi:predicted RNA-binding Zn-ribbon protein involved in translation (DUF1610 family)